MIGLITRFFPNLKIAGVVGIVCIVIGTVAGWKTRDYFADRKAEKLLEQRLHDAEKNASEWKRKAEEFQVQVAEQNSDASKYETERAASRSESLKLSAQVMALKARFTRMEKASVVNESGDLMCERTDPCHWLLINAAVGGTKVPAQCFNSVPADARDKLLPATALEREGQ